MNDESSNSYEVTGQITPSFVIAWLGLTIVVLLGKDPERRADGLKTVVDMNLVTPVAQL